MTMTGDGESQPVEGVDALSDLADALAPVVDEQEGDQGDADPDADEDAEDDAGEPEESDDEDEAEDATFTVKVNGKEVSLTKAEVVEMASKGADYTQKTMAVAEERKAAEAERAHAEQVRQQYSGALIETVERMTAVQQFMQSQLGSPPPIEWAQQDANYYLVQKEQYESRRGQLEQASAEITRLKDEQHRQRQSWLESHADSTLKHLRDTLPGWNDDVQKGLATYLGERGLTLETAGDAFVSKGMWELAHKAKAYDAIQAKKAEMKPTQQLAKVAKPSAANPVGKAAERAKRDAAFNKNPSVDALADLLR